MSSDSLAKLLVVLLSLNRNQLVGFFKHMIYKVIRIHFSAFFIIIQIIINYTKQQIQIMAK
jgi:hypothetical protein